MADMIVNVLGDRAEAERACRMVFGENANAGPRIVAPSALLNLKDQWPAHPTDVIDVALETPWDFDVEADMAKGHVKALVIRCCRITVLHGGKRVGYALRTDEAGINAIQLWERTKAGWLSRIRQAH